MALAAIVLGAGAGTRMKSELPKVLHKVGAAPLLHHALKTASDAGAERTAVVVGHGSELGGVRRFCVNCLRRLVQEKSRRHSITALLPNSEAVYVYMRVIMLWRAANELIKDTRLMEDELARHESERASMREADADRGRGKGKDER